MKNYFGVDFEKQKQSLLKSKAAKPLVEDLIKKADDALAAENSCFKMSEYMLYVETGDRTVFQHKYFKRRDNCSYIAQAYWLSGDEKYKKALIDYIFYICDEFSWCVPAHASLAENPTSEFIIETIDLFQSETSRLLTEIAVICGEKLPYYVLDRIEYEIRRRIITPIKTRHFWWQDCNHNWAAVCSCGVLAGVLHFAKDDEIKEILPLLYDIIDNFLSGFNDDGCCLEGYSYWNYGFGQFVYFAKLILSYTNGEVNYFEDKKVKAIATYAQKVRMGEEKVVSFSDCGSDFSFSVGLMSLLKSIYPNSIALPDLKYATAKGNVYSIKEFAWFLPDYKKDENILQPTYFEGAQWFVSQKENYSFAAKGGNNAEPHNHNDIGSFMVVDSKGGIPLADLGSGVYNRFTFNNDYRYKMLQNGSRGHSVPIINGKYQKEGKEFKATNVKAGDNDFSFDMENAYEKGLVNKLNRSFYLFDKSIKLTDVFEYSSKTEDITERMVSCIKPEIFENFVDLGSAKILFDCKRYTAEYSVDSYRNHKDTEDVTVYLIDFKPIFKGETVFEFGIKMN